MRKYFAYVTNELKQKEEFIKDTMRYMDRTLDRFKQKKGIVIKRVGSMANGTSYCVSKMDCCLDLMMWNTEIPDPIEFQ